MATVPKVEVGTDYKEKYGFFVPEEYIFKAKRGLNPEIVKEISFMKKEPEWMLKMRLRSLEIFRKKPMPTWGADLSVIDFENIFYYLKASDKQSTTWEDLPPDIKKTYDRLGVPEAERKFLAGVSAQYESEVVYHSLHEELSKKGVIFTDTDSALRDHPELFKEYFGTVIPPADNKFAALNTAVWSGGSFIYVPKGVRVDIPLQAYFRINAENMGQFERTLIICDEGSFVHYIEGCHSPNATVRVSDGEKAIQFVEPGDFVLTHKGRWREVLETQKRKHRGDLLSIEFEGERYRQLSVTPGHPFLVGRREADGSVSQDWREAHQLRNGDLLAVPVINQSSIAPDTDLSTEVSVGRGRHTAVLETMTVKLTQSTCWLIGAYLAEGSAPANRSYVNFDSHTDEIVERQRIREAMLEAFELEPWEYTYANRAGVSLRYSSVHAARWFIDQFGRLTAEKRLPDWVFGLPAEQRAAILAGLYAGEGYWSPDEDKYRINQTNQSLAQRMREILLTLGIRSTLARHTRPEPRQDMWQLYICQQDNRLFEEKVLGTVPLPRKHPRASLEIVDGFMWVPIRSINAIWTEIDVYNLKVEEDESYVCEGVVSHNCTAPIYTTDSLHSAVVEIIVKKDARCRYTTIQNWSTNVFNLVTKRALAYSNATMEWVDGNLGSQITMKYPSVYLMEPGAKGDVLSVAFAGKGQHQDAGGKMIHVAPNTTSTITSKSISKGGGRTSYRGHIKMYPGANNSKSFVKCDALLLDDESRSDTYPYNDVDAENVTLGHEATVSKVSDEQLFYLMSRGITRSEAETMIVNGFIEPFTKELPLEYAVELNRLIQLEMEGSVG
jgi:Fe-S cluster assembly protein SufB